MSVKKIISKTSVLCILFACLVCFSCKNDENIENEKEVEEQHEEENEGLYKNFELPSSVHVVNASEYSHVVAVKLMVGHRGTICKFHEFARSDWNDGSFSMVLPAINDSVYFESPFDGFRLLSYAPTVTISNINVKDVEAFFIGVDKDDNAVAVFSPFREDVSDVDIVGDGLKVSETEAFFQFVDANVTISGYSRVWGTFINPEGSLHPGDLFRNRYYLLNWVKGWNIWFLSKSYIRVSNTMMETEIWSTVPVDGLKWYGSKQYYLWMF